MKAFIPREPDWLRALRMRGGLRWPAWARLRMHPYPEQFSPAMDLPPRDGPARFWLMATTPRSGSHFLGHLLQGAGHFGCPLEYMNPMNLDLWRHRFGARDDGEVFDALTRLRSGPTGLFGIKAHWNQWAGFSSHDLIARRGGFERAIWIYRRDLLAQAISRTAAVQTGQWIGSARARGAKAFDYGAIVRNARMMRKQNEHWAAFLGTDFAAPSKTVVFEDVAADPEAACREIGAFLDPVVPELRFEPRTTKQSDGTSREWADRFRHEVRPEHDWILTPQSF
ncbi:Stf0 sulfotransferase family protein [Jannaschia sp. W003]|uniref:Stf0 sulfotransferase family protein n=1 Tax=Jannaschia sp. W003 TaxID=2867012 RepID=UPI0021A30A9F|nr:Stf0 sulfotransferase family protein [Jannaschia sp. W003]UWQ23178.1 Stf0 sulfotransferase family protein [Jannaschia sp. W003]